MGLVPKFSQSDINREILTMRQRIDESIIKILQYLGEKCVVIARENGQYRDQTGNLRNSVGYVVYAKGKLIAERFDEDLSLGDVGNDINPTVIAKRYADEIAARMIDSSDYVLVVVAGMEYASVVESRGKDVLTSAEQYAEQKLPVMMAKLKANINRMR